MGMQQTSRSTTPARLPPQVINPLASRLNPSVQAEDVQDQLAEPSPLAAMVPVEMPVTSPSIWLQKAATVQSSQQEIKHLHSFFNRLAVVVVWCFQAPKPATETSCSEVESSGLREAVHRSNSQPVVITPLPPPAAARAEFPIKRSVVVADTPEAQQPMPSLVGTSEERPLERI